MYSVSAPSTGAAPRPLALPGTPSRWPGLALVLALAIIARAIGEALPLLGGAVCAILLGVRVRMHWTPSPRYRPGIAFASRSGLQVSIVLLGFGLDFAVIARTVAARRDSIDAGITAATRTFQNTATASAQAGPLADRIGRSADAIEKMGIEVARTSVSAATVVNQAGTQLQGLGTDTLPEVTRLLGELNALSVSLRRLTEQTERDPRGLLFGRKPVPPGPGETSP